MSRLSPASVPAPLLVLAAVVSVQLGGALAAILVPQIGAGPSVLLRLLVSAGLMVLLTRPRVRGYTRQQWLTVAGFGLALGLMNWSFYASLAHLPIGVAVTVEFIGPLTLATVLSRRARDLVAVAAAAVGVVLISEATRLPLAELDWTGLALALAAGVCWAAYIVLSGRTGAAFPQLDGLTFALVVAAAVVVPAGIVGWQGVEPRHLAYGAGVALLSSVLPYSLELLALRRLSAQVFGILLSLEPAVAALAGLLVLGQRLHGWQLVGMALVVSASVVVLGLGRRRDGSAPDPLAETGG